MIPGIQSLGMSQPPNFYRIKARVRQVFGSIAKTPFVDLNDISSFVSLGITRWYDGATSNLNICVRTLHEPQKELRDVIKNAKRWDDYLIIDVRDGDYAVRPLTSV